MTANPKSDHLTMTKKEYLEFLANSDIKYEHIRGVVYAMAGASPNHNRLAFRLGSRLDDNTANKDCEGFSGDQLIEIEQFDSRFYPDLSVVCGEPKFTDDNPQALLNPILVIEVLSPSTEKFDRDEKFRIYRGLDSLREYVLVSQDAPQITSYYLNDQDVWEFRDTVGLDSEITLQSIDCTLSLADVYQRVTFEDETNEKI